MARGIPNPGDSSTSGKRPRAGAAPTRAWVRVPARVEAGTTPPSPLASSSSRASSTVMYGAGVPVPAERAG